MTEKMQCSTGPRQYIGRLCGLCLFGDNLLLQQRTDKPLCLRQNPNPMLPQDAAKWMSVSAMMRRSNVVSEGPKHIFSKPQVT